MSAEDRRKQLIEIAIDLFSRKGFAGTTTKEIAAAAGVTEAIIFRHFPSKSDFYNAILDRIHSATSMEEWLADTQRLMDQRDDAGLFRLIVGKIIDSIERDPRFERLMMLAAIEGHELAEMHMRQVAIPIGEQVVQYLRERQRDGALVQGDARTMLMLIAGSANFYAVHRFIYSHGKVGCDGPETNAVDEITRFIRNALLTRGHNENQ